jgi:hypothetical protein
MAPKQKATCDVIADNVISQKQSYTKRFRIKRWNQTTRNKNKNKNNKKYINYEIIFSNNFKAI